MNPGHDIAYKSLRKINPEAARQAVLDDLESIGGISQEQLRHSGKRAQQCSVV